MFNPCFPGNQPLPKTKGASIQQSVFSTPNLPLNSKDALNESLSSATFQSVHPPNQLSVTAVSQNTFNHGGGTNNASVVPIQVPNTTTNGVLFDTSVRSYQQMGNRFVSTNQQIPDLTSKSFGSTLPQSSQYYQSSASHSGRFIQIGWLKHRTICGSDFPLSGIIISAVYYELSIAIIKVNLHNSKFTYANHTCM